MKISSCTLGIALFLAQQLLAQEPLPQNIRHDTLAEVVITAWRRDAPLHNTPAALEKLTQKKLLARQERSTPEALMSMPGVFVQKTNHGGGSPFLRGLTGNQTLLLVDGIRLSNATFRFGPNQYLNTIDPFSIENIEVWKGGGSVGYGSDALGGTVNVLTQTPDFQEDKNEWSGKALGQWRNEGMEKTARLQAGFSSKKMALLAGGTLRHFGDLAGGDTTGRQSPSGYDEAAFDGKGKFRLGETTSLMLAQQFFRQKDVPVFHKIQLEDFAKNLMTLQQRQLTYLRLESSPAAGFLKKITATASLQQTDEHREIQKNGSSILRREADDVSSLGATVQAEASPLPYWLFNFGMEMYHDKVGSIRTDTDENTGLLTPKRGLYPDGSTHASYAVFWLNHWKRGSWNFSGGLRFNQFSIKVEDETIGQAHLTPGAFVWNAAVLRHLSASDKVFFDFNSGFRAPNVDDLGSLGIVDFRYELPTANLTPEKTYNFELGWRHRSERWMAQAFVFRNELRDLIARVRVGTDSIAGYPVFRKENVEAGHIHGFETAANLFIFRNLSLQGALAWQLGQNVTNEEPLRRIPPVFGRLALNGGQWAVGSRQSGGGQLSWTLEGLFAGKQDRLAAGDRSDNRIPAGGTPGWLVVNVFGSWEHNWWTLRAGLWNVLNADYRYHGSGVNGGGRSGSVGVEVRF